MKTYYFTVMACCLFLMSCGDGSTENTQNQTTDEQQEAQQTQQKVEQEAEAMPELTLNIAKKYVPKGFKLVAFEEEVNFLKGDFNGDNAEDFAMMVASDEAEFFQDAKDVRIMIFEASDDTYEEAAKSGNLDGYFIHNAETNQLHLNKNVISIQRQDMRFDNEWKFRYEKSIEDYALIGSEYNSYGNAAGDGSGNRSTNYLSGKSIENFNEWDMENEKLNKLPTKTTTVNSVKKKPILLRELNAESFYDL